MSLLLILHKCFSVTFPENFTILAEIPSGSMTLLVLKGWIPLFIKNGLIVVHNFLSLIYYVTLFFLFFCFVFLFFLYA